MAPRVLVRPSTWTRSALQSLCGSSQAITPWPSFCKVTTLPRERYDFAASVMGSRPWQCATQRMNALLQVPLDIVIYRAKLYYCDAVASE